jgi:hypothetical protein
MKNKKLIRLVESFVILPIITMSVPAGNLPNINIGNVPAPYIVSLEKETIEVKTLRYKAEAIDAYFKVRNMPLEGMGMKMVEEAEKNKLDWRLLPAIAVRESTGGKFDCQRVDFNAFGWGSCKIGFKSNEHSIEIVAKNLGGNNPGTARYYANKNTKEILLAYNPPSIVKHYSSQVISIMNTIGEENPILEANS